MEFPISDDGLSAALDAMLAAADAAGVPRGVAHRLAVIVDEYCSNLIRHDPSITRESRFTLEVERVGAGGAVSVRDNARPFDPTAYRIAVEREIGGQGIAVMRGLASRLEYASDPGGNLFRATVLDESRAGRRA